MAAQTLESSFYSKSIIEKTIWHKRLKILVYFIIWFTLLFMGNIELSTIIIITQIIFSEFILVDWLFTEWLYKKFENVFNNSFSLLNVSLAEDDFNIKSLETIGIYEMIKANSCITLSGKTFKKINSELDKEWKKIRKKLNI
jgi:hypothetical protein